MQAAPGLSDRQLSPLWAVPEICHPAAPCDFVRKVKQSMQARVLDGVVKNSFITTHDYGQIWLENDIYGKTPVL